MNRLLTLLAFAASLYGCQLGATTTVQRVSEHGHWLDSTVVTRAGVARFACRASDGDCRYTLYRRDCRTHACTDPLAQFTLANGAQRTLTGLPAFRACVRSGRPGLQAGCDDPPALATR